MRYGCSGGIRALKSGAEIIMKIGVIIQARTGSTRLPGKVLKVLKGRTVLNHVIERVKQASHVNEIIVATTNLKEDDAIVLEAEKAGVKYFRGDESDVLSRYYHAAKQEGYDIVVRITSDCPLIDPELIDALIKMFLQEKNIDYMSNVGCSISDRTYPRGLDIEVFTFDTLAKAFEAAKMQSEREHVTPYIYNHPEYFNTRFVKHSVDYSHYRWTLDTEDDWKLIQIIYERLYKSSHDFYFHDLLELFLKEPHLADINSYIEEAIRSGKNAR